MPLARLDALPVPQPPGQLAPPPEQPEAAERRLAQPPDDLRRLLLEPRDEPLDLAGLLLVELVAGLEDLAGQGGGLGGAAAVHPPGGVDGGLGQVLTRQKSWSGNTKIWWYLEQSL